MNKPAELLPPAEAHQLDAEIELDAMLRRGALLAATVGCCGLTALVLGCVGLGWALRGWIG